MTIDEAVRAVEIITTIGKKQQALDGLTDESPISVGVFRQEPNERGNPWHDIEIHNAEARAKIVEILNSVIAADLAELRDLGISATTEDVLKAYKANRQPIQPPKVSPSKDDDEPSARIETGAKP